MYAHHLLRQKGHSLQGFEAGPDVGGTWFWNGYPGARCDVESLEYCYSFSDGLLRDWEWSERYATQPEILRYANHVADRFDLRRDIAFETRVVAANWDAASQRWHIRTDQGDSVSARFLVAAVGCLSAPKEPEFAGLDTFSGQWVQTSRWPREPVEIAGKRIAVIGTGSSGIQAIPVIAREAAELTVFQRTPNFTVPAGNGPHDPDTLDAVRKDHPGYVAALRGTNGGNRLLLKPKGAWADFPAEERRALYEGVWPKGGPALQMLFTDGTTNLVVSNDIGAFVHGKIAETVTDPAVAELLSPRDHPFGTKRLCLDTDYYATFNRPNVSLVDLNQTPIVTMTEAGIRTTEREYAFDLIVIATGFDAVTGPFLRMNITGANGLSLSEAWRYGPATYLGLMIAGFPNLFMVTGPGSPSVLTNMIVAIEQHVEWIAQCIADLDASGVTAIEADPDAQVAWTTEVAANAEKTLFPLAKSWYLGDNVPGKPRVFLPYIGGFANYARRCEEIVEGGYRGFTLNAAALAAE